MKIIQKVINPKILVITPLKINDKISKETKISIKRNNTPFDWISYENKHNPAKNTALALFEYEKLYQVPNYIIIL